MAYGRFPSFEEFLDSYIAARKAAEQTQDSLVSFGRQKGRKKGRATRDLVEIRAMVRAVDADDLAPPKHQHLKVRITEVVEVDPDVETDVDACHDTGADVFVSIRYGDRIGLLGRISEIVGGMIIGVRGEWIPRDKAYAHGGEKLSVLHFTHEPLGWVETPCGLYS